MLLTGEHLLREPWPREAIDDLHALPDLYNLDHVIYSVSFLARSQAIDVIVALDDFDVETAARLREHLRIPGMGDTTARYFRDKLAMRMQAQDRGIRAPRFVHILNHMQIKAFIQTVPAPWVLKPRSQASAVGIKKLYDEEELWRTIDSLGDQQSFNLLEEFIPGDVYHIDSIVLDHSPHFTAVSQYASPPLDVAHGGGIFCTRTIPSKSKEARRLIVLNEKIIREFGLVKGVTHTEFIRSKADGHFYFLETAARVGGAHIAELIEAASGINLWREWARIEIADTTTHYQVPESNGKHAGLVLTLARQTEPDTSDYVDEEICWRLEKGHHVGLIVKSGRANRIRELTEGYMRRFRKDFHAALPAPDEPTH